ncbi:MAG TPA: hypothetical protein VK142_00765 [Bacillota bacterium]|nr:hypothetical protein [Bacillota bacterium]
MFKRMLTLGFILILVSCSSNDPVIEKKNSPPDDPDQSPKWVKKKDEDDEVSFIEFSLQDEKVRVNLDMVPILGDYIEASASPEKEIQNMGLERVQNTNKKMYILSFSCNNDLCSYILFDEGNDHQAILLADIASLVQITPSPDDTKLLLQFEREESLPLPLTNIIVINTENWEQIELENETNDMEILEFSWPLLDAEWVDDDRVLVSKPTINKPTEEEILEWQETEQPSTHIEYHTGGKK